MENLLRCPALTTRKGFPALGPVFKSSAKQKIRGTQALGGNYENVKYFIIDFDLSRSSQLGPLGIFSV